MSALAGGSDLSRAQELYTRAAAVSDVGSGAQPFALHAAIEFKTDKETSQGTVRYLWNGPAEWRAELVTPDYRELRIGGDGRYWRVFPPSMHFLHGDKVFGLIRMRPARFSSQAKFKKIQVRKDNGSSETCVLFEGPSETCFDDSVGYTTSSKSAYSATTYSDYREVAGTRIPFFVVQKDSSRTVTLRVTDVSPLKNPDPSLFRAPAIAREYFSCDDPTPPKALQTKEPDYSTEARKNNVQGTVGLEVVVDVSGNPLDIVVVRPVEKPIDAAAIRAVSGWKFQPAMCGNTPMETEVTIEMNFRLY